MVTESGKVATWLDESVAHVCARLEHPATSFPEFSGDKVATLHTCVLFTAVTLEQSRQFFWWGILPFSQRKKLLEKYANKKRSSSDKSAAAGGQAAPQQQAAAGGGGSSKTSSSRRHRSMTRSSRQHHHHHQVCVVTFRFSQPEVQTLTQKAKVHKY